MGDVVMAGAMSAESLEAFHAALEAGERAHVLTIGSPARTALRVARGNLDREGRWHPRRLDVFPIIGGRRREFGEIAAGLARRLARPAVADPTGPRWSLWVDRASGELRAALITPTFGGGGFVVVPEPGQTGEPPVI